LSTVNILQNIPSTALPSGRNLVHVALPLLNGKALESPMEEQDGEPTFKA